MDKQDVYELVRRIVHAPSPNLPIGCKVDVYPLIMRQNDKSGHCLAVQRWLNSMGKNNDAGGTVMFA